MELTRRAVTAGLGFVVGLGISPVLGRETEASTMQAAAGKFRAAAKEYNRVWFETFYEGAPARRTFDMRDWASLLSWDAAIGRLRRAAQALLAVESEGSYDVLCKFEIAEAFFGRNALPDTEWSFSYADAWMSRIEADASRFGLAVYPAWSRKVEAFFDKPDVEFYSVLGRIAGRVG